jgi:hypothetical protein
MSRFLVFCICCSTKFAKPSNLSDNLPHMHAGPISISPSYLPEVVSAFLDTQSQWSTCFANITLTTFTRDAIHTLSRILNISVRSGYHQRPTTGTFSFEDSPDVKIVSNPSEIFWYASAIGDGSHALRCSVTRRTTIFSLLFDGRVNETKRIQGLVQYYKFCWWNYVVLII